MAIGDAPKHMEKRSVATYHIHFTVRKIQNTLAVQDHQSHRDQCVDRGTGDDATDK